MTHIYILKFFTKCDAINYPQQKIFKVYQSLASEYILLIIVVIYLGKNYLHVFYVSLNLRLV